MAKRASGRAAKGPDKRQAIIEAALELAATQGWRDTSLADIAETAGVSLAELRQEFSSRTAILTAYSAWIDAQMLEGIDPELKERPVQERLFDLLMRRFDALNTHKAGVRAILRSCSFEPEAALCAPFALRRSMRWALEGAGLSSAGLRGVLGIKALGLVYLAVIPIWLRDDSEDMARTMAALDRRLQRLDRAAAMLCRIGRPRGAPPAEEAPAEAS